MAQRISKLASLMNGSRALRGCMAGNAARKRELGEQSPQSRLILTDIRVHLAVGTLEIGSTYHCGSAMSGARHVDHVQIVFLDGPIQVRVNEVLTRRGAPVA